MTETPVVAVLGGGISGLAAAHSLANADRRAQVIVIEADQRLGGCIRGAEVGGVAVDTGPDSVLARVPWGRDLLIDLGLQEEFVSPAPIGAHLWLRGALRPLPPGLMTGKARPGAVRRAGLLSWRGQLRAGLDYMLPGKPPDGDESVADAIGKRLGREAVSAIADPLLGGVYAGSVDRLSSRAAMPAIAAARDRGGSLLRGLRAAQPPSDQDDPVFVSLRGGLAQLPDLVAANLRSAGAQIQLGCKATALRRLKAGIEISLSGRGPLIADGVVMALPAAQTAALVESQAPVAGAALKEIRHARVAIVTLAFQRDALPQLPSSSGFLSASRAELTISACSLTSQKWPHLAPEGPFLLRCSVGRADQRPPADDDELIALALRDLRRTFGIHATPIDARVDRYENALPQHEVGHFERLATIEADVAENLPGVALAGAWTRGIGIAACVRDGRRAAEAAIIGSETSDSGDAS